MLWLRGKYRMIVSLNLHSNIVITFTIFYINHIHHHVCQNNVGCFNTFYVTDLKFHFKFMLTKNKLHTQVMSARMSLLVACKVSLDTRNDALYILNLHPAVRHAQPPATGSAGDLQYRVPKQGMSLEMFVMSICICVMCTCVHLCEHAGAGLH